MTPGAPSSAPRFADEDARRRISEDLEANLLVEAGAGSGKTTELVNRMVALLGTGTAEVGEIAAVTFTRKAAGELKERFQAELERRVRAAPDGDDAPGVVRERLRAALHDLDQAFVGTIHSFCGRLLRERPLEVGLDPGFEELAADERLTVRRQFWDAHLERLVLEEDPDLEALSTAGLRASALYELFETLVENPDVAFSAERVEAPSEAAIVRVRAQLERIVDRGWELMPEHEPDGGWDSLQRKIRHLRFTREITAWADRPTFFDALSDLCKEEGSRHRITQKRWKDKALAKAFGDEVEAFGVGDTEATRLLRRWREHRYALVVRLARRVADAFWAYRRRAGRLDFQDLLLLSAELLRSHSTARRELGLRYRRLLVDEFQDTDPLQAELMLLLASDPGASREGGKKECGSADWRTAVPRPGALFVVGDPKQSIYRFRRADIQLYQFVKERFARFGGVLELTTNFRSRAPIGALVNELFPREGFFPETATAEQASFEPLLTVPREEEDPRAGVFHYQVLPDAANRRSVADDESARVAAWIHGRVTSGERLPGSFMLLTRQRASLETYARALEAWGIPVQVTGAGVGVEEELRELRILMECMIDPTDPVKVVASLVGLFFGLDYERLLAHRLAGGGFDAMRPGVEGDPDVLRALSRLHRWWRTSATEAADVFVSRIVSELGLLPFAAAGDLGSLRAGAMVFALDTIRAAALSGEASLPGALEALDTALALSEAEAPLEPGRSDAVRVMNLHQAKGLEADVVILADPSGHHVRAPELHVRRLTDGTACGYLRVAGRGFRGRAGPTLALAPEWDRWDREERGFSEAEETRLLYVAVTRAREELWIGRWPDKPGESPWRALDPWLLERASLVELPRADAPARPDLAEEVAAAVEAGEADARNRLLSARNPGHAFVPVTTAAKGFSRVSGGEPAGGGEAEQGPEPGAFRGFSWGTAVHGALAFAAGGPDPDTLGAACRSLLVENGRPLDDHGEPFELAELLGLVRAVQESEIWRRAVGARRMYTEIPLAARADGRPMEPMHVGPPEPRRAAPEGSGLRQLDLFAEPTSGTGEVGSTEAGPEDSGPDPAARGTGSRSQPGSGSAPPPEGPFPEGPHRVLEGVIDLVFEEPEGWVIVDYKTDVGTDPRFEERVAGYRRQVDLYADAWRSLTSSVVKERVLFFTSQGRVDRW